MYRNEYPYTNFHDINLDWVLEKTKECVEKVGAVESVAQEAKDTSTAAKTEAETAKAEAAKAAQAAAKSATDAQEAKATADGVDAKATEALQKAGNAEAEVSSATQAAAAATQAAQNATNTAAAAQTTAENAQAAAEAAAADAQTAAGSVSEFDGRITASTNTANQAKSTADTAQSTATEAKNTADTNTAAISGIQTKIRGIAKMYNITVGTVWTSDTGYVKQEIAVAGLVPGAVNIFDLDLQPEQLSSATDYLAEWAKIIKCETQSGHVNIYATEATTLQLSVVLGVVTNG